MIVRWRTRSIEMLPLLVLFTISSYSTRAATVPRVWLVQPQSRILEHDPTAQRLAETKCPTMKKDSDPKSTLPAGGIVDIIWHNPFHLNGPTKFELLSGEEILAKLEPIDESGAANDKNRSTKAIRLPDFECKSCVLRLTQFTDNTDTEVVSCADVQILQLAADSNSTTSVVPQSKGDCVTDKDCGKNGECSKGLCFCPVGRFGRKCDHDTSLALSKDYTPIELSDAASANGNSLQWRYDSDSEQLEFAFQMPADSWVALGLRNKEAAAKCSSLLTSKDSNNVNDLDAENSLTPGLNIRKIVGNYLSTTASPESLECGPNEEFSDCPEFSRECESSCEWTLFPESVPACPKSCGLPRCVCKPGFVREANDKNECRPFEFCMALQASTQQCNKNQTWAKCGVSCEPSCESMYNTDPCTAICDTAACSCDNNYVRHNGECIFWGDCPNLEKRVLDENDESESKEETLVPILSKRRENNSTPKPSIKQPSCPANETFNKCGRVCETECHRIFDREECNKCEKPECACQQGFARRNGTCVYWNDCINDGSKSTSKLTTPKLTTTPKPTKKSTKVSIKTTTTVAPKSAEMPPSDPEMLCFGEYVFPPRCEDSECLYKLSWAYVPEDDNVEFSLETRMNGTGWTGVGFSPTGSMTDADFIIISSDGKSLNIKDMHADSYNSPKLDKLQSFESSNVIGTHVDGVLKATFLRKRNTGDDLDDANFGDKDECYHFLFPTEPGELAKDGSIAPHTVTPMISSTKICIRACAGQMQDSSEPKINIPTYTCQNEFHYPVNCSDNGCEYKARWAYDSSDKSVMFEVSARGIGRWTAIGFSHDGMENADIILGWVYQGKPYVLDRFAYGRQLPIPDPADKQDIYAIGGRIEDDIQTITFKRKLVTKDSKTDLQLDKCYYFLFPVGGGRILTRKSQDFENAKTPIGYHDLKAPERSAVPVCICDENNKPIGETPPIANRQKRQVDPFDEKISPGDLSHLLPAVKKLPGGSNQQSDAFACSDVSIVELSKKRNVRVVDGFALSTESLQPDEAFGGIQSLPAISVLPSKTDKNSATVVLRKKVKTDDIADFNFADEIGSLVFASGPAGTSVSDAPFVKTVSLNLLDPKAPVLSTNQAETISTTEQQQETTAATTSVSTAQFETTTAASDSETTTVSIADLEEPETTQKVAENTQKTAETTQATTEEWISDESNANCAGSFYYPSGCKAAECKYVAKWGVDSTLTSIRLRLEAQLPTKYYTGFGFSRDGSMANTDAIIVSVLGDSTVEVSDQFSPGYGRPTIDAKQDLKQINTAYVDGRVMSTMIRSLSTYDNEDADLLADCHYLIFVPSGGNLEEGTNAIRKHSETPLSSKVRFCPAKCQVQSENTQNAETTKQTDPSTTKKPKLAGGLPPIGKSPIVDDRVFDTVLRVMGREWGIPLENIQSPEAQQFTSEIIANLKPLITKKWKSLKDVNVTNYAYSTSESIGVTEPNNAVSPSILALTQFTFDAKDSPSAEELRNYLKEITAQSLTGPLSIDHNAVQVQQNEKQDIEDKWGPLREISYWVAIIAVVVFVLLSLLFLCLCCGFCGGRRKTHKFQPEALSFGQPPHSSYHHYSTSYPTMGMTYEAGKADSKGTGSTDTQTQNSNGNGVSRRESNKAPRGIGEATYQEWYSKVASKDTPSHHQESMYQTPPTRMLTNTPHQSGAYVTYPNDPSGYYTLNGDNRMPPPSYFRHY